MARDSSSQHIQVTVDAAVFSVRDGRLQVLLIKRKHPPYKGKYAIPGGFVKNDEGLDQAIARELEEETGVDGIFLKKLTAYGDADRDPRGRVVTVVFLALIDADEFELRARTDALEARWFSMDDLPPLGFDHDQILHDALAQLRLEIQTTNIASQLLPDAFTLSDLQCAYESILGRSLDKRNFRKRIAALDILKEAPGRREGAHRPAQLYRFRSSVYQPLDARISVFL